MGRTLSHDLAPAGLPGGYANLLGPDAFDQIPHLYGPNTERLLAVKARVDPDYVFAATPLPGPPRSDSVDRVSTSKRQM